MTWTLSTLKTAIQDYSESTETSFVTNLPNFIKTAEERILKTVQLDDFIKNVTGTATASSPYIGSPSDYLSSNSLAVIDSSSNYNYLQLKHPSFIRDFTPASSTTGLPKYYAEFDENTFIVGPTPDANYTIELHFSAYPESIVTAGTTWLGDEFDSALLNGALVEAIRFMKGEPDMVALYEKMYQQAISLLQKLGNYDMQRDTYRGGRLRVGG